MNENVLFFDIAANLVNNGSSKGPLKAKRRPLTSQPVEGNYNKIKLSFMTSIACLCLYKHRSWPKSIPLRWDHPTRQ